MNHSRLFALGTTLACASLACQTLAPNATTIPPATLSSAALPGTQDTLEPTEETPPAKIELANGSIGDAYAPDLGNSGYDVIHYTLVMTLDPALQNQVEAEVSIELSLTDALESLSLDFIGFDIQDVLVNGESTEFQRTPRKLLVLLPENSAAGDSPTLTVRYNGQTTRRPSLFAPFESHLGLFFPDGESLYVLSEPDGSRYWFPNNDHPRDKATYRFELTVPSRLMAVANGTLLDTQPNGDHTTYIWEHDAPMASYLATVAVGRYTVLEGEGPNGLPLRDYVFSADLTRWEREFANTAEALAWFEGMLGPYPFETYGHVDVNASGIALETQTMVVMSTDMIDEDVMVHEMAHQWFGDWVSLDSWGEMWRNEGFASYFEFLWPEREGLTAFNNEMNLLQASIESRDTLQPLDALSPSNLFGYEVYIKGAVVAHALRNEVGDEAFFSSLRLYFSRYGGATASNADFQEVFEETSGQDLDEFFSYWLSQ